MRVFLSLLALALSVVLGLQWRDWPPPDASDGGAPVEAPAQAVDARQRTPLDLLDPPVEKEEYAVIAERPLFTSDRRPVVEDSEKPEEPAPDVADADLERLDLSAVVITLEERTAWVRDPTKTDLRKLRLGDELEGWTVKAIRSDEIELERQGQTDTLILRDYARNPPSAARPPPVAARPLPRPSPPKGQRPMLPEGTNPPPRPGARQPQTRLNAKRPPLR